MKKPLRPAIHRGKAPALDREALDGLAAEALTYLAGDPERLRRFFDVTGLSVETLRRAAGTPDFTTYLLDYIAADERLFLAVAAQAGHDPATLSAIRAALTPMAGEG